MKYFRCFWPNCHFKTKLKTSLSEHQLIHTNIKPFKCDFNYCNKVYKLRSHLFHHKNIVHLNKRIKCDFKDCDKTFTNKYNLFQHKSCVHLKEKRFKCNEKNCGKMFATKQHLIKHKLIHSGEKPFRCDYNDCNKGFIQISDLVKHKSCVHFKEKLFKCNEENCGKGFGRKSTLISHKFQHLNEKPFKCDFNECNKRFTNKSHLNRHKSYVHLKENISDLIRHNGTHLGEKLIANIYHAYHLVKSHGIPDSNIIVMHYDDIAHHDSNPTPGVVVNQPNGTNVYEGVPKHYTGEDVSAKNFLRVIKGDPLLALSGKKVLRSGPLDNVFIYFSDHGGHALVAFASDYLYANDLNDALQYMYRRKMYSRLVFYMEACYSGSMFDQFLPNNINVYANTAANTTQSSYSRYYDSYRKTWLGDSYSSHWMENSEASNLAKVTLEDQYVLVKNITTTSHVQQYGDMTESNQPLSLFLGVSNVMKKIVVKVLAKNMVLFNTDAFIREKSHLFVISMIAIKKSDSNVMKKSVAKDL
ncbi:unnamed protein product [Medioppia subpectinata]|uniref:legumain n=1 Tax=Medioppia subpectinata TaxID=1979941 RepID=A0A7R9PZM4_9ACAR|nr:unnamed protein product [Medioppia subpectinata]CAG2106336.1 unnamed protein product [Medioppia subpectinata]